MPNMIRAAGGVFGMVGQQSAQPNFSGRSYDGALFVPAAAVGDEQAVTALAAWDSVTFRVYGEHHYLPPTWIACTYPEMGRNGRPGHTVDIGGPTRK
jgi:hypothetical protein